MAKHGNGISGHGNRGNNLRASTGKHTSFTSYVIDVKPTEPRLIFSRGKTAFRLVKAMASHAIHVRIPGREVNEYNSRLKSMCIWSHACFY